ncbi:MAG: aminoglycoside phosphotransferase family protein [Pirellulales bacterium]
MFLIDAHNAERYLRERGWIERGEAVRVSALTGGVSNQVLYVARPERPGGDFVLKQARAQLRTPDPWFASIERIWREIDVLDVCAELIGPPAAEGAASSELKILTPRVLYQDRDNYAFAMTAAPLEHRVWKADLLAGRFDPAIAAACGRLLSRLHSASWLVPGIQQRFDDRSLFEQLRVDPYYRAVARRRPEYAACFERLIDSVAEHRRSLVHADFSPKNLLVFEGGLLLVDFETGHFGDPAFDLGFFLSHLVLKAAFHAPQQAGMLALAERFWSCYQAGMAAVDPAEWVGLEARAVQNLAGCAWARLEGTSQVDYLADPARRDAVVGLCQDLFGQSPGTVAEVLVTLDSRLHAVR